MTMLSAMVMLYVMRYALGYGNAANALRNGVG